MFGCKQSGSRSQALCLCLRLLRQLGAGQESSPRGQPSRPAAAGGQADGQMDGQMDGRTDGLSPNTTRAEASVRRGLYCRAGSQRGAAAPLGSGFLKAVGAHLGENSGDLGTFGGGRGTRSGVRATSPGPAPSQEQPSGSRPWVPPWG